MGLAFTRASRAFAVGLALAVVVMGLPLAVALAVVLASALVRHRCRLPRRRGSPRG